MQHDDLEVLLRSRVPLIAVESRDESEVLKALTRACARMPANNSLAKATPGLSPTGGLPLFQWTVTDGLKRLDIDVGPSQRTVAERPAACSPCLIATSGANWWKMLRGNGCATIRVKR